MSLATSVLAPLLSIQTSKFAPHSCTFDFWVVVPCLPSRSSLYPSLPFSVPQEANLNGCINRLASSNFWLGLHNGRHWMETRGWEGKEANGCISPSSPQLGGRLTGHFSTKRPWFLSVIRVTELARLQECVSFHSSKFGFTSHCWVPWHFIKLSFIALLWYQLSPSVITCSSFSICIRGPTLHLLPSIFVSRLAEQKNKESKKLRSVQYYSHQPRVNIKHLKCAWSECAVSKIHTRFWR